MMLLVLSLVIVLPCDVFSRRDVRNGDIVVGNGIASRAKDPVRVTGV